MSGTPLPRSLTPLPDESLPGYILRLAHRLDLTPARLEHLTGLAQPPDGARASNMITLTRHSAATFARTTRLTPNEVAALTLDSLSTPYPPLNPLRTGRHRRLAHGMLVKENWIFARFTRHCPQCLAGDGSDIQNQHGGAWSKLWRLPVVFACTAHQRLLAHACPACGQPALARDSGTRMLPRRLDATLHPVACRANLRPSPCRSAERGCGQRLDQSPPAVHDADSAALALQERLLTLLHDNSPTRSAGGHAAAGQYVTDLRILSCVIGGSWPLARPLVTTTRNAALIDRHVEHIRRQIAKDRQQRGRARDNALYDKPPTDAATNAALLTTASAITSAGDSDTVRHLLANLLDNRPSLRPWIKQYLPGDGYCSPGLHTALGPEVGALHIIKRTGVPSRATRRQGLTGPPPTRLRVQHIPQRPPQHWIDNYLSDFTDLKPRLLQHAVAIRLAHIASDSTSTDAATHLGIPRHAAVNAMNVVHRALTTSARTAAFHHAVDALAHHLDTDAELLDYGRRRDALANWQIPEHQWREITDGLPEQLVNKRRVPHTDWGHGKRRLASTWVWTEITHGDHIYAPTIRPDLHARRSPGDETRYIYSRWNHLLRPSVNGHFRALREQLNLLIGRLAYEIDANEPSLR
ncbi:TniQ family protein [Micromonospora tulbaghiae]|uniref:TniQ family protein n=1 Tax=Micromonospora TaxID=1873 RepID=UPI003690E638